MITTAAKYFFPFLQAKISHKFRIVPKGILFPLVWITNRCNLKCKMCDQWKIDPAIFTKELSAPQWFSFIDSARNMNAMVISITGGEPLLRQDIFDIIRYIRDKGMACHLCSNGSLLDEDCIKRLKGAGLNSISISLDSFKSSIHDELRGVQCFEKVVEGIGKLKRLAPKIKIGINCLITALNFREIYRMIPMAQRLKVNQIKFDFVYTNLKHRDKPQQSFGDMLFTEDATEELRFEIDRLLGAIAKTKILTNPLIFLKHRSKSKMVKKHLPCYAGYISCAVDALGYVSACENQKSSCSLKENTLKQIWNSCEFQKLREDAITCDCNCWDSTHTALNFRCSAYGLLKESIQILRETAFYMG